MRFADDPNAELCLWSDEPAEIDLLAFGAVAETVIDAVLDDDLDPLALGLSGAWGSGKTTVLRLVQASLAARGESGGQASVLTLFTVPWCYDPAVGAKQCLIGEVLECLEQALATDCEQRPALKKVRRLIGRVELVKALQIAARTSLTLQLPSIDELTSLVRSRNEDEPDDSPRTLEAFREEFRELMTSADLNDVKRLVVLVDDLDRCLPETVVETLETIRLFLAVPGMAFVVAADEARVADAISRHFQNEQGDPVLADGSRASESPAQLYLHKMLQTTIPIPGLSRFDTETYVFLLQMLNSCEPADLMNLVSQCEQLRKSSSSLNYLETPPRANTTEALEFAQRLTPILYEKLMGNPRRIKRFLNDLHVRQSVAKRRGITLNAAIIAKLMVLETLLPESFREVLDWFATNQLRERLSALEAAVGSRARDESAVAEQAGTGTASATGERGGTGPDEDSFAPDLLRWAKLAPSLASVDLGPYLFLAAAFGSNTLLDAALPEHLRDVAANLLSGVPAEQKLVTNAHLSALNPSDVDALMAHLATAARDRPIAQTAAVRGLLRLTRIHTDTAQRAASLLTGVPTDELNSATIRLFEKDDVERFRHLLRVWHDNTSQGLVHRALQRALNT